MSAKINLYSGIMAAAVETAVEPKEGYVYVVTKVTFQNEGSTTVGVTAGILGEKALISSRLLLANTAAGWEGTEVLEYGRSLEICANPQGSVRCIIEGYFLIDVAAYARFGAGSMDSDYARMGCLQIADSRLEKLTYLTLVELKRIRGILKAGSDADPGSDEATREIESELES